MSLKTLYTTISSWLKKYRIQSIVAAGILLVVVVSGVLYVHDCNVKAEEERLAREAEARRQEQFERYTSLYSDLEAATAEYNNAAEALNTFLSKAEPYHVLSKTDPLSLRSTAEADFEGFVSSGGDFSELTQQTEQITSEKNQLVSLLPELHQKLYKGVLDSHNMLVEAYNTLVSNTSSDFIKGIPQNVPTWGLSSLDTKSDDEYFQMLSGIVDETNRIAGFYTLLDQITNPDEQWILGRISNVESVIASAAVTESNDPNGLLGKEGGYTSCIYFSAKGVDQSKVKGSSIIERGTDGGGAIEAYSSLEAAKNRCDYLSQFDNTLLYSGSYALIGTMVVRTSYQLTTQEQIDLTNEITEALTEIVS